MGGEGLYGRPWAGSGELLNAKLDAYPLTVLLPRLLKPLQSQTSEPLKVALMYQHNRLVLVVLANLEDEDAP